MNGWYSELTKEKGRNEINKTIQNNVTWEEKFMKKKILSILMAVSYTHLDVYKRQVLDGNISIYSYESNEEKISDTILKPQYIPDNYRLNEEKITDTTSVLEYGNDKKHLIFQQTIVTNEKMIFDTNYNSVEQIRINGMTVFLYRYTDETFWAYGEYGNSVYVLAGDTIPKEEIEKIYKHWIW